MPSLKVLGLSLSPQVSKPDLGVVGVLRSVFLGSVHFRQGCRIFGVFRVSKA